MGRFKLAGNGTLTADRFGHDRRRGHLLGARRWLGELIAGNAGSATESSVWSTSSGALSLAATTSTDPGTIDAATSPDGHWLYVQTGGNGIVDEFRVGPAGSLTEIGSVTVPDAVGGQGIATS